MTFFRDLSNYRYFPTQVRPGYLNVGWLGEGHEFPKGETSPEFLEKLLILAKSPANLCRGTHDCEFCANHNPFEPYDVRGHKIHANGEIHVQFDGVIYCAPRLIVHYIYEHKYLPPREFVRAVLDGTNAADNKVEYTDSLTWSKRLVRAIKWAANWFHWPLCR